jgi:hypothetical protein
LRVDVLLDILDLHIDGFGDEEVDAVAEVFEKALVGLALRVLSKITTENMVYPNSRGDIKLSLTVVRKIPAAVDTSERVHMRSGISMA